MREVNRIWWKYWHHPVQSPESALLISKREWPTMKQFHTKKYLLWKDQKPLEKQECSFLYMLFAIAIPAKRSNHNNHKDAQGPHSSRVPRISKNSFLLFFFLRARISLLKRVNFKNFLEQFLTLAHILKTCKDEISDKCSFLPTKFGLFRKLKYKAAKSFD